MQKLISKYGLAAHLAFVAVAPLFLPPVAVVWLSVLGAVWLFMEPSRIGDELMHEARRRVARSIFSDPVFWVFLSLVVISVVRALNVGVEMAYDAETGKWGVASPGYPLLPGSVEGTGFPLVGCAAAACVVVQGCRHGLGRSARGAFALVASLLSGAGACVWAFLFWDGSPAAATAVSVSLTDPVFAGCTYGIFLVCSVMALVTAFEARWLKAMPLFLPAIGGNALGLFLFAPAAVVALYAAVALIVFLYAFVYLRLRLARTSEFKFLVFVSLGLTLAALALFGLFSPDFVTARTAPFMTGVFVPAGFIETRDVLSDISSRIWLSSPWLGYGHGSFPLSLQFTATPADWQAITPLQKAVPNGYWMLLAERGIVGAFFLAVPMVLLLITYVRRLVFGVRRSLPHPLALGGFLLLVAAVLEMFVDVAFLAPGAAVALVAVFSLSAAAFPKEMSSHG